MATPEPLLLRFDDFELDQAQARLSRAGQALALPPRAFDVLCTLAGRAGQLVTKDALLDAVWGHQHLSDSVLKTTISELRATLGDDARQPRYIETAARRGYRFIGALRPGAQAGVPATPAAPPAPAAAADTAHHPVLIGREAALGRLRGAWQRAESGRRQIVWACGEAGIGKTTLIEHFAAERRDAVVAHGQCVEQHGAGEPYLPVLEALAAWCRHDPALVAALRSIAPTWLVQLPWLVGDAERASLRRELSGTGQERMLREWGELLDRCTAQRPLLFITEDLHWSDHATLSLIDHVARRRTPARVMWLASFRLAEVIASDHPLKALRHELRLHGLVDELLLDPFSEQELGAYLERRAGGKRPVPQDFTQWLHGRTDGLPLFVINVVDDLLARRDGVTGLLDAAAGVLEAPLQVPENLAGVIERQIDRLPAELRIVLEAASICGVEFRAATVAHTLERDEDWVSERCNGLVRRQQWLDACAVEPGAGGALDARFRFRHALYRQVFHQRIGELQRAQWHRRVAAALRRERAEGRNVTAVELAAQHEAGHEWGAALRAHVEAAENALRRFAPREALDITTHARALLPAGLGADERDGLELALCALQGIAASHVHGVSSPIGKAAYQRALDLLDARPDHPQRGMVPYGMGTVLMFRGEYAEARALGERCLARSHAGGDVLPLIAACSVLGQVSTMQGDVEQSLRWLEQGLALCERAGDAALESAFVVDPGVRMQVYIAVPLLYAGRPNEARAAIEAAHRRAERLGQPMARTIARWYDALIEVRLGRADRVAACAEALREVAEQAAVAHGSAAAEWFAGWAQARLGAPREGLTRIREAYARNLRLGMGSGRSEVLGYLAEALLLDGDLAAAQGTLDEAIEVAQRLGERVYLPQLLMLRSRVLPGEAQPALRAAIDEARSQGAPWLELEATTLLHERDGSAAAELAALRSRINADVDLPLLRRVDALLATALGPAHTTGRVAKARQNGPI